MAAVMPLIAQTFVDSRTNTTFDIVNSSSTTTSSTRVLPPTHQTPSRQRRLEPTTPSPSSSAKDKRKKNGRLSRSPRQHREAAPVDVNSWSDETLAEKIQFTEEIGYGNWGSVWKGRPKEQLDGRNSTIALKLVHRTKSTSSSARVRALWQEYKCIRFLRSTLHPNLIAFHSFIITPSYCMIAMDFHPRLMAVALPESKAKPYFQQLLSAVEHLHVHGITHNDIKPSNVLLAADDRPVLVDFGFAQQYSTTSPDRYLSSLSWGTPEYLSPERAKGKLHDERLSDIWALGITMYEVIVGRTPFEQSENEDFLNREQLEIYYHRTLTGRFYGDYIISSDFEHLVRLMVEPEPHLRLQSCGRALRHRFFDPPQTPVSNRSVQSSTRTSSQQSTPTTRPYAETSQSSAKRTPRQQTPKTNAQKGFEIFQDENAPSPARTADSVSPFSPRPPPLANRTNDSPSPALAPVRSKAVPSAITKTPPPSRIPVRKCDISSPTPIVKSPSSKSRQMHQKRFASEAHPVPVPPLPAVFARAVEGGSTTTRSPQPPTRSSSLSCNRSTSVASNNRNVIEKNEREKVDSIALSTPSRLDVDVSEHRGSKGSEQEILSSSRQTSPVHLTSNASSDDLSSTDSKTSFLKRSFSTKVSLLSRSTDSRQGLDEETSRTKSSPSPVLRKASASFASRMRKLSAPLKNVRGASSSASISFAGLGNSLATGLRRRSSLTDSVYSLVEPDTFRDSHSMTMPVRLPPSATIDVEAQNARLAAFSAHVQHIMESRNVVDPLMSSFTSSSQGKENYEPSPATQSPPKIEPAPVPFSFNGTTSVDSKETAEISPETPRKAKPSTSKRSPRRSPVKSRPTTGSAVDMASRIIPPALEPAFKPGHRRIPTAIRNVPSVVLYESADDENLISESDESRAETPFERRVASPPPPPRIVEPSRQLPTWIPDSDSDSEDENLADVDEPTIKLDSSPRHASTRMSKVSRTSTVGKSKSTAVKIDDSDDFTRRLPDTTITISLEQQRVDRPAFSRSNTASSTSTRPTSPVVAELPFRNLDPRSDSRASTVSSVAGGHGHSRSSSVISFFTRSMSRASNTSSLGWSTSSEAPTDQSGPIKPKKGGKLRRAVSKVFR